MVENPNNNNLEIEQTNTPPPSKFETMLSNVLEHGTQEDLEHVLLHFPTYLNEIKDFDELKKVLISYPFLKEKTKLVDINQVINDYSYEPKDQALAKLQRSLQLSRRSEDIAEDLPTHLYGRLKNVQDVSIKGLLTSINEQENKLWLKPLYAFTHHAESPTQLSFIGHEKEIHNIQEIKKNNTLISSDEETIFIWDSATGAQKYSFEGTFVSIFETENTNFMCFSTTTEQEDQYINYHIHIWNTETEKMQCVINRKRSDNQNFNLEIRQSKNSDTFLCSDGETFLVASLSTGGVFYEFPNLFGNIDDFIESPTNNYFAIFDKTSIQILNPASSSTYKISGDSETRYDGSKDWIQDAFFTNDGKRIMYYGRHTIHLYNLESKNHVYTIHEHKLTHTDDPRKRNIKNVLLTQDNQHIISFNDTSVSSWAVDTGELEWQSVIGKSVITRSILSQNQSYIICVDPYNITVLDTASGKQQYKIPYDDSAKHLHRLEITAPQVTHPAYTGEPFIDWEPPKQPLIYDGWENLILLESLDGTSIIYTNLLQEWGQSVKVCDLATGKVEAELQGFDNWITNVIETTNRYIVSTEFDRISIFDKSGKEFFKFPVDLLYFETPQFDSPFADEDFYKYSSELPNLAEKPISLKVDRENEILIALTTNGIKVVNCITGEVTTDLQRYTGLVQKMTLSSDKQSVYTTNSNNIIQRWNIEPYKPDLQEQQYHTRKISVLKRSVDEKHVYTVSEDQAVKMWDISLGRLIRTFKQEVSYPLKEFEKGIYGRLLFILDYFDEITVWNKETGSDIITLSGKWDERTSFSKDRSFNHGKLAITVTDKEITARNMHNNETVYSLTTGIYEKITSLDKIEQYMFIRTEYGVEVRDISSGKIFDSSPGVAIFSNIDEDEEDDIEIGSANQFNSDSKENSKENNSKRLYNLPITSRHTKNLIQLIDYKSKSILSSTWLDYNITSSLFFKEQNRIVICCDNGEVLFFQVENLGLYYPIEQ